MSSATGNIRTTTPPINRGVLILSKVHYKLSYILLVHYVFIFSLNRLTVLTFGVRQGRPPGSSLISGGEQVPRMAYSPSNLQDRRQAYYVGPSHAGAPALDEEQRRSPSLPRGGVGRPQNDPHQLAPTVGPTGSRSSINRTTAGERVTFRHSPQKDGSNERPQAPFSRAQKGKAHMGGPSQQRFPQRATQDLPKKPVYNRIGRTPAQGRPRTYRSESSSSDERIPSSEEDTDESSSSDEQSKNVYRRHKHVTSSDSSS